MTRFQNKVALVTGGGSGIGRATVLRLASEGAAVVIADIKLEKAQTVAAQIESSGGHALVVEVDVSTWEGCQKMAAETERVFGRVDVVFANAGISGGNYLEKMEPADWQRVIETNLSSVFLTCKACLPLLIRSGEGAIVINSSSMAGWDTSLTGAAYMASKEGLIGLTKSLALQLARYKVRVNAVCPGIIQTSLGHQPGMDMAAYKARQERFARRIPLRRVGQPEDVAAVVAFLASGDACHVTGAAILIDGGQTLQSWSNAPDLEAYPWENANLP